MCNDVRFWFDRIPTPVGELVVVASESGSLRAVNWPKSTQALPHATPQLRHQSEQIILEPRHDPHGFTTALRDYFAGELTIIDHLPVSAPGTAFQQSVWSLLRKIPCGVTISYGQLAGQLGNPAAVRAVGLANGANPVGIVVPCHRVIGTNGSLTGYGGGLERKRWLLAHERVWDQAALPL